MANMDRIRKNMEQQGVSAEILAGFDFNDFKFQKGNRPEPRIAMIHRMDELLTKEQCLAIMEKEGCCKGGQLDKDCKAFAKEHKGKPLAEKLKLMSSIPYMMSPVLNDDGSFTITMSGHQNGVHTGKTTCSCGAIKKLNQPFSVSPTYCGCCAGHFLYHYQNALSVKLRLKEIISSPLNTNGEKPCSFTFEIVRKEKTPVEMVQILPNEKQKQALEFINLGIELNCKAQTRYATANKYWRCVFLRKKSQRVLFTVECTDEWWRVKACLWNIEKYGDSIEKCSEKIKSIITSAYDCKMCSNHCSGGAEFTFREVNYKKCIGCCFYFTDLRDEDWQDLLMLIKKEHEASC